MKVIIANQFNSDNIGDKLIGKVLYEYFTNKGYSVELAGYAQTTEQKIFRSEKAKKLDIRAMLKRNCPAFVKYLFVYRKKVLNEIRKCHLSKANALIIGGGQLLKHGNVFPYCFKLWVSEAVKIGVPIFIYGVGVDNNLNYKDKHNYYRGLDIAKYICCRDNNSVENLRQIINKEIEMFPDVVFSLKIDNACSNRKNLVVMPYHYETAKKNFGIIPSREIYYNSLLEEINKNLYNDLIITATTSVDLEECYLFGDYLRKNDINYKLITIQNEQDLLAVYRSSYKVYSGRMHAMIVAMLADMEIVPIEISPKIQEFKDNYIKNCKKTEKIYNEANIGLDTLAAKMEKENGKHSNSLV